MFAVFSGLGFGVLRLRVLKTLFTETASQTPLKEATSRTPNMVLLHNSRDF